MKKILAIVLALICAVAPMEAAQHLTFMGLELDGTPEAFKTKFLRKQGVTFDSELNGGTLLFYGPFMGYQNCEFYLFNEGGRVNNMDVYLPVATSWNQIKRQYRQMVAESKADTRFTVMEEHAEFEAPYAEGDGDEMLAVENEKCSYSTLLVSDLGYIKVSISKFKQVYIIYYDFAENPTPDPTPTPTPTPTPDSGQLSVFGFPIQGSASQFANKLVNSKGCRITDDSDPNWLCLRGSFAGQTNCEIYLGTEDSQFKTVAIYFPEVSSWREIKRQYETFKTQYDTKYTVDKTWSEFRNGYREGDGREVEGVRADECYFITTYKAPGGKITLYISKYMQVAVIYEATANNVMEDI